jgi:hypothetical protein
MRPLSTAPTMRRSRLFGIGLLVIAPVVLPALAYASPPDPSWIQGVYDDADHDDAVILATGATGDIAPAPPADRPAAPRPIGNLPPLCERRLAGPLLSPTHPRAPPGS